MTVHSTILYRDGKLVIGPGGPVLVKGAQATAVDIGQRLMLKRGSWFADLIAGVPYLSGPLTNALARDEILKSPGVIEVLELENIADGSGTSQKINATVLIEGDLTIQVQDFEIFSVQESAVSVSVLATEDGFIITTEGGSAIEVSA